MMIKCLFRTLSFCLILSVELNAELWKQDVTSEMRIGLAETGYRRVDLRCGADAFLVNVTLNSDFEGVVYTRGSFDNKNNKTSSCFKDHRRGMRLGKSFLIRMEIPFDECHTVMDVADSRYSNRVIVQHDPEFIMPGDAAFAIDCPFMPEFKMTTNMMTEPRHRSRITLIDADPASSDDAAKPEKKYRAESNDDSVSFFPLTDAKDEL